MPFPARTNITNGSSVKQSLLQKSEVRKYRPIANFCVRSWQHNRLHTRSGGTIDPNCKNCKPHMPPPVSTSKLVHLPRGRGMIWLPEAHTPSIVCPGHLLRPMSEAGKCRKKADRHAPSGSCLVTATNPRSSCRYGGLGAHVDRERLDTAGWSSIAGKLGSRRCRARRSSQSPIHGGQCTGRREVPQRGFHGQTTRGAFCLHAGKLGGSMHTRLCLVRCTGGLCRFEGTEMV